MGNLNLMTLPHPSYTSTPLSWVRKARVAAVVVAIVAALAACSPSGDDEPASSGTQPAAAEGENTGEENTGTPDTGGYTSDDVGNGTLRVNGVEFPDFTGDCEISRENGKQDVGDLNVGDIVAIIGIDNVTAHEDMAMNYTALNEERFTFRDSVGAAGVGDSAKGDITTLTELGPRTADGSRDIVEVRFAGVLDDGTTVDADVVCELQNTF